MEKDFYKREDLLGKLVVDQEASITGKIKDFALTKEGEMGLLVENDDGNEQIIMLEDVKKIGEVVLLKSTGSENVGVKPSISPETATRPSPNIALKPSKSYTKNPCKSCSHENRPGAKFCVKCGSGLG